MGGILGKNKGFGKAGANTNSCSPFINQLVLIGSISTNANLPSSNGISEESTVTVT